MATKLTDTQTDRDTMSPAGETFEISKTVSFEAAHRLPGRSADDAYGRVHGHSFTLTAVVAGKVKEGEQWVEDLGVVSTTLKAVAAKLDHQLLNDIPGLDIPTLERICIWASKELKSELPGLVKVSVARPSLNESCSLVVG